MAIPSIYCLFDRHRPIRDRISLSGADFSGRCHHCGATIRRRRYRD